MIGGALLFGAALYIGVPLTNDAPVAVERYATREEIPGGEQDDRWKTTWLLLRLVPATDGPVRLGDPSAPPGSWRECRDVELTQAFYLGVYEITARQAYSHCASVGRSNSISPPVSRRNRPRNESPETACPVRGQLMPSVR